jgi:cytochrome c5
MNRPFRRLGQPAGLRLMTAAVCAVAGLTATQATHSFTPPASQVRPSPSHATVRPVSAHAAAQAPAAQTPAGKPAPMTTSHLNEVVDEFCVKCHFDGNKAVPISLASFDVTKAVDKAEIAERMIRKLQAGMMPPPGVTRPDPADTAALIKHLETTVDAAAAPGPIPAPAPSSGSTVPSTRAPSRTCSG